MGRDRVIGIGNEFRRDDGVGIAVARALKLFAPSEVDIRERGGEGTDLIAAWEDASLAVVIDAVSSGGPAGAIHRFEIGPGTAPDLPPAQIFRGTSHQIGLGEGIALARLLGKLPPRLIIYGIEGVTFGDGVGLSDAVGNAVERTVAQILSDLQINH